SSDVCSSDLEPSVQEPFPFGNIGGEHLHKTIGKPCFKDTPGDSLKRHLETQVSALPPLLGTIDKPPECLRVLCAVPYTTLCSIYLNIPGICFTGCQSFHFQQHGHFLPTDFNYSAQRCIIPGITGRNTAFSIRAFCNDLLQLCKYFGRFPTQT